MIPIFDRDIKFPYPLLQSEDHEGVPVFGFSRNGMFIHDPFLSDCGRFSVDPVVAHDLNLEQAQWLKDINASISPITDRVLDAMAMGVLEMLGLDWKEHLSRSMDALKQGDSAALTARMAANHIEHQLREEGVVFEDNAKPAAGIKL